LAALVVWQAAARMFQEGALFTSAVIAAEEMPAAHRGTAQGLLGTVNALGSGFGALLLSTIDRWPGGWRGLCLVSLTPLVLLPFLRRAMPESRRWLARSARPPRGRDRLLSRSQRRRGGLLPRRTRGALARIRRHGLLPGRQDHRAPLVGDRALPDEFPRCRRGVVDGRRDVGRHGRARADGRPRARARPRSRARTHRERGRGGDPRVPSLAPRDARHRARGDRPRGGVAAAQRERVTRQARAEGPGSGPQVGPGELERGEEHLTTDIERLARDQITAHIGRRFVGHDLARLVAAVPEAEGYVTKLSPPGPDAGVDVLAA